MNEISFEVMHNIPAELKLLHCAGNLAGALTGIGLKAGIWGIKIGGAAAAAGGGRVLQDSEQILDTIGTFTKNAINETIINYPTELYYANIGCQMGAAFADGFDSSFPSRVLSNHLTPEGQK